MERMQAELYFFFKVTAKKLEKIAKTKIWEFCYKLNTRHTL